MEEQKLNFNAPLMSVRRFSATSSFSDRDKQKKTENSSLVRQKTLPFYNSEVSLDQVTEPVAVPFRWEQIPGKAKGRIEHESQPNKEDSGTPRLPPGRVLDIIKYPVGKEVKNQNVVKPEIETYHVNDNVTKLICSYEGMNEKYNSESDNDAYSDALDTLSPTDSFSMNCSVSDLSELGAGAVLKRSGTFSTDQQTRDFMMSRFLPAAKAMTLETPKYASRKQSVAPEKPREVKKVVVGDRRPLANQHESIVLPHYNQDEDEDEEETEDEYDDDENSGNLSRKACGLLPKLCLLNPVPGLKVRTRSSMPSTGEVAKPGKAMYTKSHSQILEKQACNAVQKNRSNSVPSLRLPEKKSNIVQSLRIPENKSDIAAESPRLRESKAQSGVQSPMFPENKADSGVQSFKLRKTLTCGPNQLSNSSDQHIVDTSPIKRLPGSSRISPYRRERPQSPFRGGGFLGIPKEAEKYKANMLVKYTKSNSKSHELVPYQSTRQGSGYLSPAVEKTLYVDTLNFAEISSSNSDSSGAKFETNFKGEYSDTLLMNRMPEEPASLESSLQLIKYPSLSDGKGISEDEFMGSVNSSRSSLSDKPDLRSLVEKMDCFRQNEGQNQESKSLGRIKVRADKHLTLNAANDSRAADQGEAEDGSGFSPLPPPLPKIPSESWLWRALPSRNSFSKSYNTTRFNTTKYEHKEPANETKWETIVKTSYLHHDHVRYSEELVSQCTRQSKT